MRTSWRALALLPLLAVTACGRGVPAEDTASDTARDAVSAGPDGLVLQLVRAGGFLPLGAAFRTVPAVSVYADGSVVSQGAQIEVWPAPALPSVQVGRLGEDEVRRLVEAGREVVAADYGQPPVADAPTTAVVVQDGERRAVATAVALEELSGELAPPDAGGLTEAQRTARERLSAYVRQLQDAASAASAQAYEPERLAVLAEPYGAPPQGRADVSAQDVAWPGPALAADDCVVVTGEQLEQVLAAAGSASVETRWTVGGAAVGVAVRLAFRPLLRHEQTCDDAQEAVVPPTP